MAFIADLTGPTWLACSCCVCPRAVDLFRAYYRPVMVVFLTCYLRVFDNASGAVKSLN